MNRATMVANCLAIQQHLCRSHRPAATHSGSSSKPYRVHQSSPGKKFTNGVHTPVFYLRSPEWSQYFRELYQSSPDSRCAPLLHCPLCPHSAPPHTPHHLLNHLSYRHMHEGWTQHHLDEYHHGVLREFDQRLQSSSSKSRYRLVVWLDVANVDFASQSILLEVLQGLAFRTLFQSVPIAWCTTQELFIPHTCATVHGAYQLSCLHSSSDFFPFYAATGIEAGDLTTAALLAHMRKNTNMPPTMLVTMDAHQRQGSVELFGNSVAASQWREGVAVPINISTPSFYHTILQALGVAN